MKRKVRRCQSNQAKGIPLSGFQYCVGSTADSSLSKGRQAAIEIIAGIGIDLLLPAPEVAPKRTPLSEAVLRVTNGTKINKHRDADTGSDGGIHVPGKRINGKHKKHKGKNTKTSQGDNAKTFPGDNGSVTAPVQEGATTPSIHQERISWGKHKGELITSLQTSYLIWCLENIPYCPLVIEGELHRRGIETAQIRRAEKRHKNRSPLPVFQNEVVGVAYHHERARFLAAGGSLDECPWFAGD